MNWILLKFLLFPILIASSKYRARAFVVKANQGERNVEKWKTNQNIPKIFGSNRSRERSTQLSGNFRDDKSSSNLYQMYIDWLDRSPLIARSVTAAVVGCIGDVMAQRLEASVAKGVFKFDWIRFNAFFVSGLLYVGPFLQYWYGGLWAIGRWMERKVTKKKIWQTLAQVFVDQTIGVLVFFPIYFYAYELSEAVVSLRSK